MTGIGIAHVGDGTQKFKYYVEEFKLLKALTQRAADSAALLALSSFDALITPLA